MNNSRGGTYTMRRIDPGLRGLPPPDVGGSVVADLRQATVCVRERHWQRRDRP